jgi:hypothetical protein
VNAKAFRTVAVLTLALGIVANLASSAHAETLDEFKRRCRGMIVESLDENGNTTEVYCVEQDLNIQTHCFVGVDHQRGEVFGCEVKPIAAGQRQPQRPPPQLPSGPLVPPRSR